VNVQIDEVKGIWRLLGVFPEIKPPNFVSDRLDAVFAGVMSIRTDHPSSEAPEALTLVKLFADVLRQNDLLSR
jgi:hypothetical protein